MAIRCQNFVSQICYLVGFLKAGGSPDGSRACDILDEYFAATKESLDRRLKARYRLNFCSICEPLPKVLPAIMIPTLSIANPMPPLPQRSHLRS